MSRYPHISGIEIEGELGRGAHSVVYRGRQNGVACAVKLPRTTARWTRWIYREAVALARVKHPSLPAVLEVGEVARRPYLVMELVEGETLADKLEAGALDEAAALAIARQLASVLVAVHDAGLVHRDVKPRNIVMERASGSLKLVDFGFAAPMERVGTEDSAGTAAYAAPEQLSIASRVDARADLYALGRVLFECLAGRRLTILSGGGPAAARALAAAGVDSGLVEVVASLLQRDPDARYPDGRALLADLDRVARGAPVLGPRALSPRPHDRALVARSPQLERILTPIRALSSAGALALVRAPRGGGKTRLLDVVAAKARRSMPVASVACRRNDASLSALRRIFGSYFAALERPARAGEVEQLVGNLALVARLVFPAALASDERLPTTPSPAVSSSLAEGVAEIMIRLANRFGPVTLVVDDAQWLDPVSADALVAVAHRLGEAPVALVLSFRPEPPGGLAERFAELRPGRSIEVTLPPFSEAEVRELIASHLGEAHVDPSLVARVHRLSGGTPLGVLEVLGAYLDAAVLRPHARAWSFDPVAADGVSLPEGALVWFGHRVRELPAATRSVLGAAAVLGTSFDEELLARILDLSVEDVTFALASAARADLVAQEHGTLQRFVHDSVRDMLLEALAEPERRRLHQRAGEELARAPEPSPEELSAAAHHFASGDPDADPVLVYRVARAAGEAAVTRFDNQTAIRFHKQARAAAELAKIELDAPFFTNLAEAQLRVGAIDDSEVSLHLALERAKDGAARAYVLGRLSWLRETSADPDRAWAKLEEAFAALGARMPVEDVASAAATSVRMARRTLDRYVTRRGAPKPDTELLAMLHYQNARLGIEYGKPARVVQSSLAGLEISERGSSAVARARAHAVHAVVLTIIGRREASVRQLGRARELASRAADPAALAFCVQLQGLAAAWAGELDQALALFHECIDVHGPWIELAEYCKNVAACELIQSMRGRANDAWTWLERAVERLRRNPQRPVVADFLIHRVRAALAATGRGVGDDPWLARQLSAISPRDPGRGFYRLLSWGACVRYCLETEDLGDDFEALVAQFQAEHASPRGCHIAVTEVYLSIAHARVHQCLRAEPSRREARLAALRAAAADLRACSRMPVVRAHSRLADAYLAWFEGNERRANKLFAEAEVLGDAQSSPWVLYGVARGRAHMLRANEKPQAARDQARAAETFAREHGALTRARWVREEFGLVDPAAAQPAQPSASSSSSGSSTRRSPSLAALLQVARAPRRELGAEQQAGAILDELMDALEASHGSIWFQPDPSLSRTAVERHRGDSSVSLGEASPRGALLRAVSDSGVAWPAERPGASGPTGSNVEGAPAANDHPFDPARTIAVPLLLYGVGVGALCIERGAGAGAFTRDERELFVVLSHQVPIALELARLIAEREQLDASLSHAKKMEAMGQLAGGLAHDFNNMLAAMAVAVSTARERAAADEELMVELDVISEAVTRAAELTGQLLSFSRHQPRSPTVEDVNALVSTLEPMLRRVVGPKVTVAMNLCPDAHLIEVDQGSFDQALVNLLINARDAMPDGGALSISTTNVVVDEPSAQRKSVTPGDYVLLEVSDTGEGIAPEVLSRIFEPFFTTKQLGKGSGLGLAMVYASLQNCGGGIEVTSELGQGTVFRLYFKRAERARRSPRSVASAAERPSGTRAVAAVDAPAAARRSPERAVDAGGPDTILVVDDDELVRRSIAQALERSGYRVVSVSDSSKALSVAETQGARLALVILDVLMPGLTGPELGRKLTALALPAKILFVSGFSPETIPSDSPLGDGVFLQKPFSQTTLLEKVKELMPPGNARRAASFPLKL